MPAIAIDPARVLGPSPCDRCRLAGRCAERHEACAAFSMYVAGESERRWMAAPRAPSTARFAALFDVALDF